jgi:hypothetical protein
MDTAAAGPPDVNLYGSHPFFLELRNQSLPIKESSSGGGAARTDRSTSNGGSSSSSSDTTAAHGVFLLNSNGMDIELWEEHLTYR